MNNDLRQKLLVLTRIILISIILIFAGCLTEQAIDIYFEKEIVSYIGIIVASILSMISIEMSNIIFLKQNYMAKIQEDLTYAINMSSIASSQVNLYNIRDGDYFDNRVNCSNKIPDYIISLSLDNELPTYFEFKLKKIILKKKSTEDELEINSFQDLSYRNNAMTLQIYIFNNENESVLKFLDSIYYTALPEGWEEQRDHKNTELLFCYECINTMVADGISHPININLIFELGYGIYKKDEGVCLTVLDVCLVRNKSSISDRKK